MARHAGHGRCVGRRSGVTGQVLHQALDALRDGIESTLHRGINTTVLFHALLHGRIARQRRIRNVRKLHLCIATEHRLAQVLAHFHAFVSLDEAHAKRRGDQVVCLALLVQHHVLAIDDLANMLGDRCVGTDPILVHQVHEVRLGQEAGACRLALPHRTRRRTQGLALGVLGHGLVFPGLVGKEL